jgi:hypothetical protein
MASQATEDRSLKHCWGCGAEFYYFGLGSRTYPGLLRHWRKHWRKCVRRGMERLQEAFRVH